MGKRLERDILGMAQMSMGGAGRLGGVAAQSRNAAGRAHEAATAHRYVKGADGSHNLGMIGPQVEAASGGKFPQGPIRMQHGISGKPGYGARHLLSDRHDRAQKLGYEDASGMIKDVARNYDTVVEQANGRLMLVKTDGRNKYAIAKYRNGAWQRLTNDPFYGITTGFPEYSSDARRGTTNLVRSLKKDGKQLWKKDP